MHIPRYNIFDNIESTTTVNADETILLMSVEDESLGILAVFLFSIGKRIFSSDLKMFLLTITRVSAF
jgi:hypothetical protein